MHHMNVREIFQSTTVQSTDLGSMGLTISLIVHTLDTLNSTTEKCEWIGSRGPDQYPEHVPRLFARADVSLEQRAAVLILFHPLAHSEQLARELSSERLVTLSIESIFSPLCQYWTIARWVRNLSCSIAFSRR